MTKKITKKYKINKQKIFSFISFIFLTICIIWYGGRTIYYYLDNKKIEENNIKEKENILSETIIKTNKNSENFKQKNNTYYFYKNANNNYIKYSNLIWRILKIDENNNITLILDNTITNLAYGEDKKYNESYIINWLNDNNEENTGILEKNLNNPKEYLTKTETCIDNITNIKNTTCKTTNNTNYINLLSINDYIETGATNSFINNQKYFYTSNTNKNDIWVITDNGKIDYSDGTDIYGVKPTITLKNTTALINGNGEENNPYIIEKENTYYGSYIKLDNDIWRVYNIEDKYLKLSLNDYLKTTNENLEYIYSTNNYYHNDTIKGSLAYYLNHTYLNSLTYKDIIIEANYPNYYYSNINNYDYKEILNNTIDTKISILSISDSIINNNLNKYFTNTGLDKSSKKIYTINKNSTTTASKIDEESYIIPCITIEQKSLTKGTGTKDDPYRTE